MEWKLEVVVLPVTDIDRAKRFYTDQVGFHCDVDTHPAENFRVVQLAPPGSGCSVAMVSSFSEMAPGSLKGVQLVVADINKAREQLANNGVDVTPVRHLDNGTWRDGHGGPWNAFVFFNDPDGNGWVVQERPPA
jgi:catechol 2,3-dioxygenase-like lactoylglutathione lyase family enzyme